MSYRGRLTVITTLAMAVTLALASFVTYSFSRDQAYRQIDDALERRLYLVRAFQDAERKLSTTSPTSSSSPGIPGVGPGAPGGFTRILDPDGEVVREPTRTPPASDRSRPRVTPEDLPATARDLLNESKVQLPITSRARSFATGSAPLVGADGENVLRETVTKGGHRYRLLSARVSSDYTVQVARPLDETDALLRKLAWLLAGVTVGGITLGAVAALLVTRAASAPIRHLTELTTRVRHGGDLSERVEVGRSDDIGRLAVSVNEMLAEIQASNDRQQQLIDDASHELRTPLTSIRMNVDFLQRAPDHSAAEVREVLADLSTQTDELTALIHDLVDLRSGVSSGEVHGEVRLDHTAGEAVRLVRGAFPHVDFQLDLRPTTVIGSNERLTRAVHNLVHNAAKWTNGSGLVEVRCSEGAVHVVDHGRGVGEAERSRVFERFYRAPDAKDTPGSGLGLAIVRDVVDAHDGSVHVEDTPGGGATFVLRVPIRPD